MSPGRPGLILQEMKIRERSLFMRGGGGVMGKNLKISIFFQIPPKISKKFLGSPL